MKKLVSLFLAFTLLAGCVSFASAESGAEVFTRNYPIYACDAEIKTTRDWPLFFTDKADDMPFIDLEELADLVNLMENEVYKNPEFKLSYEHEGSVYTLTRENGFWMKVDYSEGTVTFNDYNAFVQKPENKTLLDMLSFSGYNEAGKAELFQRDGRASYDRYGDEVILSLTEYEIPFMMDQDRGYIPLQTANDFVVSPLTTRAFLFNSQAVFLARATDLYDKQAGDLTPLGELYYAAGPKERSQVFADFGVNELALMLDCQ